jgi:hypothetical protein
MKRRDRPLKNGEHNSKYTFTETPDGFVVCGEDRVPVRVRLCPTHFGVIADDGGPCGERGAQQSYEETVGLYEFRHLSSLVSRVLMRDWEPPTDRDGRFPGLRRWAVKQTAKAIGKRLHGQWERLLAKVDPIVLDVQREMFAATMTVGDLAFDEELYRHKYVVRDIVNHRAAAIAAANVDKLALAESYNRLRRGPAAVQLDAQLQRMKRIAGQNGLELRFSLDVRQETLDILDPIQAMKNWRDLFSYNGRTYGNLDRTLIDLPGGIPHTLVCKLNRWDLERAYTERLELMALLLYGECRSRHNAHVFRHAQISDIKRAVRRIADATRNELSPRRTRDVKFVVDYLADFPDEHAGTISGLARKSNEWHREQHDEQIQEGLERLGGDTETALPPKLPDIDGVRFLDTVAEICAEGQQMQNWAASCASDAVAGESYLFHVDYRGQQATVQVDARSCAIIRAYGPGHQRNGAISWVKRKLSHWCDEIRVMGSPQIRAETQWSGPASLNRIGGAGLYAMGFSDTSTPLPLRKRRN